MNIPDLVNLLDETDLQKVKSDLDEGGTLIKTIVSKRLEKINSSTKTCAVCGETLSDDSPQLISLTFGPSDFRKKASFCARDCLDYFINSMNEKMSKRGDGESGLQRSNWNI